VISRQRLEISRHSYGTNLKNVASHAWGFSLVVDVVKGLPKISVRSDEFFPPRWAGGNAPMLAVHSAFAGSSLPRDAQSLHHAHDRHRISQMTAAQSSFPIYTRTQFSADFFWNADGAFPLRCRVRGVPLSLAYGLWIWRRGAYPFA
jgi:hypothetical protein